MLTNLKKRCLLFAFLVLLAATGFSKCSWGDDTEIPSFPGMNNAGADQALLQAQYFINASQRFDIHYALAQVQFLFNYTNSSSVTLNLQRRGTLRGTIRPSCPWAVQGIWVGLAYSSRVAVIFSPQYLILNEDGQIVGARVVAGDMACVVEVDGMY